MKMSISMDGFVCGPNGEADWIFKTGGEDAIEWQINHLKTIGMIIMGRKSFVGMAAYWPVATGPFAAPMNEIPKGVFTQKGYAGVADAAEMAVALEKAKHRRAELGLQEAEQISPAAASWQEARVFTGDLATEIRRLKQEEGKALFAPGGAGFMQSLIATRLIDEFHLITHPVALGQGMPIFSTLAEPLYLKLVEVKPFERGAIAHIYQAG